MTTASADSPLLLALTRLEASCFDWPWSADQLRDWLASPGARVFALEPDGSGREVALDETLVPDAFLPEAYLLVQDHPHEAMTEILRIGVPPGLRRGGRGARLIALFMEKIGQESQKKAGGDWKIMLEVSETNTEGRALYRATGFREIHRRRNYYPDGADALILERPLAAAGRGPL